MNNKVKRIAFFAAIHAAAVMIIIAAVRILPKISRGCLFRAITGIPCPGCGLTRAAFALMRLDFAAAWYNNPTIFLLLGIVLLTIHLPLFKRRRAVVTSIIIMLALSFLIYIIRLFTFSIP